MRVHPPQKSRVRRCAFARLKMGDPQMRVRPPENGGSGGAPLPAPKWRIRRCAFARPKMDDLQVRVRPLKNPRIWECVFAGRQATRMG